MKPTANTSSSYMQQLGGSIQINQTPSKSNKQSHHIQATPDRGNMVRPAQKMQG